MTEAAAHSKVAPSAAARWDQCPGSVRMSDGLPDISTDESEEGTFAHEVAYAVATGQQIPDGATAEMINGGELYRQAIGAQPLMRWFEKRVPIPAIHAECFGTPDYAAIDAKHITMVSYKFGHRYVDAFENLQEVAYLGGLLPSWGITEETAAHYTARITVVQPRAFRRGGFVRHWDVNVAELYPFIYRLRDAAHEALGPNPRLRAGPECRDCPGRIRCPELQRQAYHAAEMAGGQVPFELPPEGVGFELRQLHTAYSLLKSRIEGLEGLALGMERAGVQVPFYRIDHGEPRERWNIPEEQVEVLGRLFGADLLKRKPITPAQARALRVIPEGLINSCSIKPKGEAKLVPDDLASARKVFK